MTQNELDKQLNETAEREFIEKGADLEHDRWARWQKYMFSKMEYSEYQKDGKTIACYVLPADLWERWNRQIDTPYENLSEEEKESDRKETRNYLPLVKQFIREEQEAIVKAEMKSLLEKVEEMKPTLEQIGEAPGDNAVGSEHRAFGRNKALENIKALINKRS